ncbi:arginine methyltransferase [Xylariaceae sp. FL0662B]|nr:arginine methyltransferase [Xylariaceae sp. FL0662B]
MFSSIASAPAKQSVGETITVLSGRLASATLLEDRRAAILGLRSFAKEYPASVASGALRSLIGSLSKDGEDVDTVKVSLETLLMLFSPNQDSPEASEEIALWLADEFTQRQENITLLLNFLETNDFYSRLYSLQLLLAILSARTERTEACVFSAPLGISRLVAVLDDPREAVRNEALTFLTYLTPSSPEIQQLVVFSDVFARLFAIIAAEGSLSEGDRIVEDCLILLANLLRLNPSNQSIFREEGNIPQLAKLLESTYRRGGEEEEVADWAQQQRNRNIYALLAVIRLFLVSGAVGTSQNQAAFWQHGVLYHSLQLAFSHDAEMSIRAEALATCADIIRGNSKLQENFAQLQVPSVLDVTPATNGQANGVPVVYVIDGLLDLALCLPANQAFDLRLAACQCIKAYFFNHPEVRLHFLRRAIEGHTSGVDETANVLTTLLRPLSDSTPIDPYRHWFAAAITFHLLFESGEAKALAMSVTEGDADSGEEVVTSIQTITAHLVSGLKRADDRISVGYLMLLIGWLFEDLDGVNDFLGEGSNIQSLAEEVVRPNPDSILVQGLCAMLLGVVYEFSTKDSPIPRATLHSVLMSRMSREKYIDSLNKLRGHHFMRNFEVIPQKADNSGNLPDVYFDATFVEFFKDNYSRLIRAIDRDPGMEISVVTNGVQKGISRELVDSLRAQVDEKDRALQEAFVDVASLNGKLGQEQAEHRRSKEAADAELARIKTVNEAIQRHHEDEIKQFEAQQRSKENEYQRQLERVRKEAENVAESIHAEHRAKEAELQRQLEYVRKTAEAEAARIQRRSDAEMADLRATISRLEVDLMKANKTRSQELQAAREELSSKLSAEESKTKASEEECTNLQKELSKKEEELRQVRTQLKEKEEQKSATQTELDDLLMVFGDLEEKVEKYKKRLLDLGETVSDGEEEGDEDEDDLDDEDGDEDEDETQEVISLLDDRVFPDVMSMLAHCREKHGFDFLGVRQRLQLDFHGCVRLVNFIRQRVHEGLPVSENISSSDIDDEQYLKPVLDDDAVILSLFDLPELQSAAPASQGDNAALVSDLLKRNDELQEELARVKAQFESYRVTVQQTLDERWGDVDQAEAESSKAGKGKGVEKIKEDESKYYWESYAGTEIHETMLKDAVRTDAYRDFIYNNKHLFAGKTVLDIGCGTGILSMFCARAGASRVLAVDASAIITKAQENVFHNGLSSTITCISGRIEEVSLPVDQVDVIVSEWMGYCLLFEAMLPSVLWARDRYLAAGGLLVPSHAALRLAPVADPQYVADNVAFWRDVYGFDMRAMQAGVYDDARVVHWPAVVTPSTTAASTTTDSTIPTIEGIVGTPCGFKLLDLYTVSASDLSFTTTYTTTATADIDALDGFLVWFDIFFSPERDPGLSAVDASSEASTWAAQQRAPGRVAFTTGPWGRETHWRQGLLLCKQQGEGENGKHHQAGTAVKKGDEIKGEIKFSVPEDHARGLAIKMTWNGDRAQTWAVR